MARKGKKPEKDPKPEENAENTEDSGASKNNADANPDSTTEDAPKKGTKRSSTAKEDGPSTKKKKGAVEENGVSRGSTRAKRATASKAEKEVKALLVTKNKSSPKKPAAKRAPAARKEPVQFEVESIIGTRKRKGRLEYKIRWKGYSSSSDTWEPARNLTNCPEILDAWKASQQTADKSE